MNEFEMWYYAQPEEEMMANVEECQKSWNAGIEWHKKQGEGKCVMCDEVTKNPPERICGKCSIKIVEAI